MKIKGNIEILSSCGTQLARHQKKPFVITKRNLKILICFIFAKRSMEEYNCLRELKLLLLFSLIRILNDNMFPIQ